jgi:hypothetical protein
LKVRSLVDSICIDDYGLIGKNIVVKVHTAYIEASMVQYTVNRTSYKRELDKRATVKK